MSRNSTPLDASRSTDTLPPSQQWQLGNLQINCKPGTQMDIPVHKGMITAAKAIKPHPGFLSAVLLNSPVNQKRTHQLTKKQHQTAVMMQTHLFHMP